MRILDTARLALRTVEPDDAPFYLELVNTPDFITHIGDRGIRSLQAAREAIVSGPMAMQAARGHAIYLVTLRGSGTPIGMAGLIKRDTLDDVDLGYAFLPRYFGQGYAYEAAAALLPYARRLGIARLVAITSAANAGSNALLRKLGMRFEKVIYLAPDDQGTRLYSIMLP
ncbi:GNAT family N-acetyltransferase [Massilia sp. PAMC28688]|uniref:GNAT family N-acetyltransferase n=1 Tax=Massilia sp. PAMC28688 TaxID=2861283 RepID=UPI001C6395C4|nr:GNAT family N-acetyltransferase [Massilia sp. PAMC28688]QYF91840.1 GNAT family N-acetyltransferase [Massilia sp. PAMC28688]